MYLNALQDVSEVVLDFQGLEFDLNTVTTCAYNIQGKLARGLTWATCDTFYDKQLNSNGLIVYMTDKAMKGDVIYLQITYKTTTDSVSVNWLTP